MEGKQTASHQLKSCCLLAGDSLGLGRKPGGRTRFVGRGRGLGKWYSLGLGSGEEGQGRILFFWKGGGVREKVKY